jgi:hypothetical protein
MGGPAARNVWRHGCSLMTAMLDVAGDSDCYRALMTSDS